MVSLKDSLKAARQRTAHGSWFLPKECLHSILTRDAVSLRLFECGVPPEVREEVLERVMHDARAVFGILVRIKQESLIADCLSRDLQDGKLPVGPDLLEGIDVDPKFFDRQWEFQAPIFTRSSVLLTLQDRHILPYLEDHKMDKSEGGYANAFRVTLDSQHQRLVNATDGSSVSDILGSTSFVRLS